VIFSEKGSDFLRIWAMPRARTPYLRADPEWVCCGSSPAPNLLKRAEEIVRRTARLTVFRMRPAMLSKPPVRPLGPAPIPSASTSHQQRTRCERAAPTLSIAQLASDGIMPDVVPIMPDLLLVPVQRCSTRPLQLDRAIQDPVHWRWARSVRDRCGDCSRPAFE